MTFHAFITLLTSFLYSILPYSCIYVAAAGELASRRSFKTDLLVGAVAGTAAFCFFATCIVSRTNLDAYLVFHGLLTAISIIFLAAHLIHRGAPTLSIGRQTVIIIILLLLAFASRSVPVLMGIHELGGDDARFHNILAAKIASSRVLADTWAPFAPVAVKYPQSSHLLTAFMAAVSGRPVHEALNVLFPLIGFLTTGIIFLIAVRLFGSIQSGLWAAATYSFLPIWGSLDYYNWAGIPNALAMLLLCLLIYFSSTFRHVNRTRSLAAITGCAFIAVAILLVHEYTFMVTGMFLAGSFFFSTDRYAGRFALGVGVAASIFTLPMIAASHFTSAPSYSNVFIFHETPLDILNIVSSMNSAFVVFFVIAMFCGNKHEWSSPQLTILAWLAIMAVAFVFLEYFYRAGSLIATCGSDCFTALTPSRLTADMIYPMSILCGWIPSAAWYLRFRPVAVAGLAVLAIVTVSTVWAREKEIPPAGEIKEAASWVRANSPENSIIVGTVPNMEYLAWRETSNPPLPASEDRRSPDIVWKQKISTYEEWIDWGHRTSRPVYFLLSPGDSVPAYLEILFRSPGIVIAHEGASR